MSFHEDKEAELIDFHKKCTITFSNFHFRSVYKAVPKFFTKKKKLSFHTQTLV